MPKALLSMVTIGGRTFEGNERFDVTNPATGEAFTSAPSCSEDDLEHAVAFAQSSQPKWASNLKARREALSSCARILFRNRQVLASLITHEQGKPIAEALTEVDYARSVFEQYAQMPLPRQDFDSQGQTRTVLISRPFGIVGLITPWNFPIGTVAVKLAPALLAGNAVILKPSPVAPLSPLFLGKAFRRILPPGILNTISGDAALGHAIARHPKIRKVSVTGSIETGKAVLKTTADEIKSVTLELGGNDPAIILPDVEPRQIAKEILESAWRNAGQVCSAIKRVYAHKLIYEATVDALKEEMQNYPVGDGTDTEIRIGPLTTSSTKSRVEKMLESAAGIGAKIHRSKQSVPERGYFVSPAIVSEIPFNHALVLEEQFAPVLPVVPYETLEQAVSWANATNYGLSASVWTSNPSIGYDVAKQIECGRVGVNGHRRASPDAPFGGLKHSGLGRELGAWGLAEMCETQVLNIFDHNDEK